MRVLVLGGTGLISQQIVGQLVNQGDEVTVLNRGRTAASLPTAVDRITADRGALSGLRAWLVQAGIDCIIDMIGFTAGEAAELATFAAGEVEHVIFCSTVDVFCKPQDSYPIREDAPRGARPTFPYAMGKVESETLLEQAAADGAFRLTILRPAQTYGGPNHGPVHPLGHRDYHLVRLATGRPILLHGDASSLWSACHARDVAAAFVAAVHEPAARDRSYNLASPELMTWEQYWQVVAEAFTGAPAAIVTLPTDLLAEWFGGDATWLIENFRFNNVFDCRAAECDLGFRPRTSLREGMRQTADDYGTEWIKTGGSDKEAAFDCRYEEALAWRKKIHPQGAPPEEATK